MAEIDGLIGLIRSELQVDVPLEEQTPLLSSGIIDSFGVVNLLGAIEDRFGVVLDEAELSAETFDTPRQILSLIETAESA